MREMGKRIVATSWLLLLQQSLLDHRLSRFPFFLAVFYISPSLRSMSSSSILRTGALLYSLQHPVLPHPLGRDRRDERHRERVAECGPLAHTHMHTNTRTHEHMHTRTHTHTHTRRHAHTHTRTHAHKHTRM
eukprot:GHVU01047817.1.p2 GENE.GHVU01047817.1~~GHVU01047817.1.p2  ORF type:complete len:132 (-),score=10.19 GHVU01047817.1:7-402(-)